MDGLQEAAVTPACDAPQTSSPLFAKLAGGRHGRDGLTDQLVASNQRKRLRRALIEAATSQGFASLTGEDLCGLAGVSKRTLYNHYKEGVAGCLAATCETVLAKTVQDARAAERLRGHWQERVYAVFDVLARAVADNPKAARLVLIDGFDAPVGTRAALVHGAALFEELLAECFENAPIGEDPPALVIKGIVLGAAHLLRAYLLAGREQELPRDVAKIAAWACACCRAPAPEPAHRLILVDPDEASPITRRAALAAELIPYQDRQRLALLEACAELAVEHGRQWLRASRITAAAQLRHGAFGEHFRNPDECLIAAYQHRCRTALTRATATGRLVSMRGSRQAIHASVAELVRQLSTDRVLARLAFCDTLVEGSAAVVAQTMLLQDFARALRVQVTLQRSCPIALSAGIGALWSIAGHFVASGRAAHLTTNYRLLGRLAYPDEATAPGNIDASSTRPPRPRPLAGTGKRPLRPASRS